MEIPFINQAIPYLNTDQMIEVDRAMIEDFHIDLIQMMENAGRNLANLARHRFLAHSPAGKQVAILAGTGGNGGGALVCARHLHNWGVAVSVFTAKPAAQFKPVPAHQLDILQRLQVPIAFADEIPPTWHGDLIIDGLIGYSLQGAPRGTAANLIQWANRQSVPILSLDVPSGLDASSGMWHEPATHAAATMTLALPKEGLRSPEAKPLVGELYLADIGVPPELYANETLGLQLDAIFAQNELLRIW